MEESDGEIKVDTVTGGEAGDGLSRGLINLWGLIIVFFTHCFLSHIILSITRTVHSREDYTVVSPRLVQNLQSCGAINTTELLPVPVSLCPVCNMR